MADSSKPLLVLIASAALETDPVLQRLHDMGETRVGRKPAWTGSLGGARVLLVAGGMGKANAAQALAAALETRSVRGVLGFGVGGAYAGSGLSVGSLALATGEVYGDEGVEGPDGWISTEGIGIPLLHAGVARCFNRIPVSLRATAAAAGALAAEGVPYVAGTFVTVSACSGTASRGAVLAARFEAVCESMEGAAYAHVAALYAVPFVEVRGISNLVEDRDLASWELETAAEVTARAVQAIAGNWL